MPHNVIPSLRPIYQRVVAEVSVAFCVTEEELLGESRKYRIVDARWVAMVMVKEFARAGHEEVGPCFGKEHSAVSLAGQRVADLCETDPAFRQRVEVVRTALRSPGGPGSGVSRDHAALSALLGEVEAKVRQLRATIEEMGAKA